MVEFWKGCPARRYIKRGEGLDAEKNDLVGDQLRYFAITHKTKMAARHIPLRNMER